jgi:hypothetical protein
MRTYLPAIIFFALLLIFIVWMIDFGQRPDIYVSQIRTGYRGVVVDKFVKKTTILKIKTDGGELIEVGILCDELKDRVEIGDRIEKIQNENYVLLEKNGEVLKLPYIYISKKIRTDRRWPKDWKDKWPESTY